MTAHTPGPWIYINDWPDMRIESVDGKYLIADYDTSFIEYPGDDETEANARLIAAAPELLAFITEWLSRQGNDVNYMTEKARAAIAKANGEQL